MFGFGKKKEYRQLKGKVGRIGSIGALETVQKYVILLEGDTEAYISRIEGIKSGADVVALTQPGDFVEFKTEQGYLNITPGSFANKTLAEQGYNSYS
jgi:hypothetical protein